MLDAASMFSDELTEAILEDRVTEQLIKAAIRKGAIELKLTPVFMGSAYKNKAVQKLLDGVVDYLPDPTEVVNEAHDLTKDEQKVVLTIDNEKPTVALAFKLEDGRYGQLTYLRIYQGKLQRDMFMTNMRTKKDHRVGRLVRMHSDEMDDIDTAGSGDIVAMFGIECNTGDTFTDGTVKLNMTSMHVPEPVISLSIKPVDSKSETNMGKALRRFTREDPTFRAGIDEDSSETIIRGMGELHLEVYIERMKREYSAIVEASPPQVAYREPCEQQFEFVDDVAGGAIPREFISAVEKGFKSMLAKGRLLGFPVVNVRVVINDGASHAVDSSDIAFQEAARGAWREGFDRAKPRLLEPIMKVVVETPSEFSGGVLGGLMQRRAMIIGSQEDSQLSRIEAEVPLAEMFGYSTTLRSSTQGKAEFTMEFSRYLPVPAAMSEELMKKEAAKKAAAAGKK